MSKVKFLRKGRYHINGTDQVIVGTDPSMVEIYEQINRLSTNSARVLITGETGVGKELVASAIHANAEEEDGPLELVNCGGVPKNLWESTLFGHVKGAFTSAHTNAIGAFEAANGGVLFLDEIGEIPYDMQSRLLRVLEDGRFRRVGSREQHKADVRVVAATNRDLEQMVEAGKFREDLFYRLNVASIAVPPLRERRKDIVPIAQYFLEVFDGGTKLSSLAQAYLKSVDWPGNVRELRNLIERAISMQSVGKTLEPHHFQGQLSKRGVGIKSENAKWYEHGVLPIPITTLANMKGTVGSATMYRKLGTEPRFFGSNSLFYLTPENIGLFFDNAESDDYKSLLYEIRYGQFSRAVQSEFGLFKFSDLKKKPYTYSRAKNLRDMIKKEGFFVIEDKEERIAYVAVPLYACELLIPERRRKDKELRSMFEADILQLYQEFQNRESAA